ncbi:hypothetical protein FQB35_02135 [Crassaminicella thermophila]|uniref:DUF4282 domain-containing protein n=1 Tax=Crassaminicella thermophila TaxID=2599308 RepID=A0A5C0S9N7_CRATE|nr:hypothetical protein [Crassaminicella thermophila]QEK11263.1 hypothetical protein FQB35_02135 [Crassaminicella thermophila]
MNKFIFKVFGPKYESKLASFLYWFYVGVILVLYSLILINILEGFLISHTYNESLIGLRNIILSFPVFVFCFRLVYKLLSKIFNWK